ncbi:hypothetical protein FB382_004334 [Nocardioides ginsengisegetis]|uniref:Uncharacterized protein n=1 Tax=Nocardioides ginsengisegetis TaxID=661491 RepID=A0A7W3J4G5_9ACTN|nr:hypothetical protein [Nocardioides ginsengisegetis]MBA8805989.1 hypothetical protein [Nocardioides ginsengisegetis]
MTQTDTDTGADELTQTEFLTARLSEDPDRTVEDVYDWRGGEWRPRDVEVEAEAAARYSDHPDYRVDWTP